MGLVVEDERGGGMGVAEDSGVEIGRERLGVLDEEGEIAGLVPLGRTKVRAPLEPDAIAEGHLGEADGEAGLANVVQRKELARGVELMELAGELLELLEIRELVGIA